VARRISYGSFRGLSMSSLTLTGMGRTLSPAQGCRGSRRRRPNH
jgi:hypothetical protein